MRAEEQIITEMGKLAQMAYKSPNQDNFKVGAVLSNFIDDDNGIKYKLNSKYRVIDYVDEQTDMQALLLERGETNSNGEFKGSGNYVLAFRGTESRVDIEVDAIIGLGNINIQYGYALEFTYKALAKIAKDKNCSIEEAKSYLTLTGHSLGGILTQQVGTNLHIEGYAYNPYGVDRLLSLPPNYPGISDMFLSIALYKIMKAVGLTKVHANWAYEHISTISYQDEGAINGDMLSNWATNISSAHLGKFIPILGKNLGLDAHFIASLNHAISEYNDILKHFNSNVTYKELTNAYLAAAIVHQGKGYETLQNEFKKLGVFEAADNSLSLDIITSTLNLQSAFSPKHIPTPALYALVHLNPFIVSGIDSPAYKELEKYKDEYSDNYIQDKADMFKKALDGGAAINGTYFKDYETNLILDSRELDNGAEDFIGIYREYHFGTNSNDTIETIKTETDLEQNYIYSLAGDDNIKIVGGSAYIEAGPGNDTIDLRSSKGENTVYGGVNNGKDNDDDGDDTIYAGQGKDTIYGGQGFDTYYVGDKDVIFDSDGKGIVVFEGVELKGGTYDKDKGAYVSKDGLIEYRLNESGGKSTLTVQKGGKSITINEFSKEDKSLGIKLANSKVEVSVTNKEGSANWLKESLGDTGLPFTLSLNRKLDKGEYLKVEVVTSMKGDKSIIEFKEGEEDIGKDFNFTWEDDNDPQGNRSFVVNASVVDKSSDLTAEVVSSARGMIKDDDRDPDNPNRPNNPDTPNDTFPDMTPASTKTSPIVIDLNGDGIKTISRKNGKTYFDLDNNKFAENTSWIDKNDGILINKTLIATNSITSGSELFGNHTLLKDGSLADNGFEALKEFDENKDGVINELDALAYENLAIWQDANKNAKLDENELKSLEELGIKEINLNYTNSNFIDENGNEHRQTSNITFTNGNKATISDVWLDTHTADTRYVGEKIVLSAEIEALPQIYAFGEVLNLHQAMAKDKVLQTMVQNYIASDKAKQNEVINDIIYRWANSDQIDPNSRDPKKVYSHVMDARQLVALEHLTGKGYLGTWCWNEKDPNPHGQAAPLLIDEFNKFAKYAQAQISAQSEFRDLFAGILPLQWEKNQTGDLSIAFKALKDRIADLLPNVDYANISADNIIQVRELINTAKNLGSYNTKYQSVFETIEAGWLSEIKNLKFVINLVEGTAGNDNLSGDNKDNNIIGGSGDDILFGGAGNDMYYFDILFGKDRVYDSAGVDSIVFSKNIKPENIELTRDKTSIYITRLDDNKAKTNDVIQIDNFFEYNGDIGNEAIEKIVFQNGIQWDINKIIEILVPQPTQGNDNLYGNMKDNIISGLDGDDIIYGGNGNDIINGNDGNDELHGDDGNDQLFGGDGNDILYGNNGSDILIGNDGNDTICGHGGNDVLEGGKGNDVLQGDYGDDTYIYSKGDGNDTIYDYQGKNTIEFKDINKDGVEFFSNNAGLLIKIKETQDTISLNSQNSDFSFKFSDGTILEDKDINLTINGDDGNNILYGLKGNDAIVGNGGDDTIYGNDGDDVLKGGNGNDSIYSGYGNDILVGGKGNDVLQGDYGDDTYIYSKGDGNDTIRDYYGKNTLGFKDTNKDGVEFSAKDNDLLITVKDTQEYITLKDIFWQSSDFNFKFADGNTIGIRDLVITFTGDDGDNDLYGYIGNDVLEGGKGNDVLQGDYGDDTYVYNKGDGNDTIRDYYGKNTLEFKDLNRDEIIFTEDQGGLLVKIRDTNEQITIMNFFNSESSSMSFKFADGTTLDENGAKAAALIGDNNDNMIQGYDSNDILKGNGGNDTIYGGKGDDGIEGGAGNDILVGNEGVDTYVFGRGDGQDVIYALDADYGRFNIDANGNYNISYYYNQQNVKGTDIIKFKEGVTKNGLIFERAGANRHDLLIKIKDTDDSITVKDMFSDIVSSKGIDKIEFADGSFMSTDDIYKNTALVINRADQKQATGSVYSDTIIGNDQDNIVYANNGDDTLAGGKGNDYLDGGDGNDVYIYNKGDGNDTIVDTGGTDIIKFGQGINKEDIVATKSGDEYYGDITLTFKNSPSDSIVIKGVLAGKNINANNKIETLEFANGERLKIEDIELNIIGNKENDDIRGYNDFSNIIKGNGGNDNLRGGALNDTIYGEEGNDYINGNTGDDILYGDDGEDALYGEEGDDALNGGGGNDELHGGSGNDTLMGQDGNDRLYGGDGNDILEGGSGNDTLYGGDGEDTYAFARGDGQDTIYADIKDTIKFKDGIKADDLMFEISKSQDFSSKDNILIRIKDTSDSILLMNTFEYGNIVGGIDKIVFHDGSSINFNEIVKKTMIASSDNGVTINGLNTDDTIIGGKGDDILYGNKGNDAIYGGSGNDTLHGDAGDDILDGGAGDDRIEGGAGSDTYMFGRGSGKDIVENYDETPGRVDIIKIKSGLSRDDLLIKRVQINRFDGLLLEIKDTDDSMTVYNAFYEHDDHRRIDRIVFEDGSSVIELEEIIKTAFNDNVILGDAEGERYYVRGNDNLIDLMQGDDYINVGGKNVTYLFGRGDGQDTIFGADRASDKVDIIRFKEGIAKEDLIFQRSKPSWYENMFVIKIKDSKDSITVTGDFLFNDSEKGINKIEFSDGSFIGKEEIINIMLKGTDLDDIVYSDRDNDIAYGRGGNDVIRSSGKNSILYGGDGDDKLYAHGEDATLYGEAGNDELYADGSKIHTLVGGTGDDTYFCSLPSEENAVTIDNTGGGDDTLILKYTDSSKDARFSKDGNDLLISGNYDNAGIIKIKNHFLGGDYAINKIVFGDFGGSINQEEINKLADIVYLSSQGGNNYLSDKDKKDNVYTYTGGKVTISDNGGDDRVVFKLDNPGDGLFYLSNGRDLKISTNKIDASNNDVLEIKNFFVNRSSIIENFDINDYWSVTAESIYEQYGKTFPPETPDNSTPSDPGGSDDSSLTGGSEDNVFNYKGGMVSITDTGGNDKVVFKNPGSRVFYSSDGIDLMISTAKIDSSNNNILQVKNFFASKDSIIETFQINDYWSVTAQSIYKAFGKTYPNQTAPVNNNPTTPPNSDNLIGGKEDNVFTYTGGKKSITDTGGNDKVIFAKQGSKVFYSSDGVNLKISTAKINSSNKDVLEVKNFFSDKNAIIEEFQISNHWTVTAESIYQAFGKTYPTSTDTQNAPLALLGTPNNTNEAGLNDNNASDT